MKGFDVIHAKSAVKTHSKLDLSRSHLTTMDFGQIVPLFVEETVPGDKISVKGNYFSRMAPLVKPTYGKFSFKTVCGFVPYHQIAVDAESWLAGKTTFEGQTPHHRYITFDTLHVFLETYCFSNQSALPGSADYSWIDSSGTAQYRIFTNQGRYWCKILNALGYALPQGVDLQSSSSWWTADRLVRLSAYPLLSFFKLYNDYMSQSVRYNTSVLSDLLYKVKYGIQYTNFYTASTGELSALAVRTMFINLFLNYENDYFTSAWQAANRPLSTPESLTSVDVPAAGTSSVSVSSTSYANYISQNSNNYGFAISQRALDILKSFESWVRRNNYSGSRSVQQIFSRFGIKTDDYRTHYAHVIKTESLPVQVGDVTATADATSVPLGDYAGKGIMNGSNGFQYDADDYGILFVFGYFTVVPMYPYGFDRRVLRNQPLDYFNPEFDGVGVDSISLGEVYASPLAVTDSDTTRDTSVFGFTERYNSYRYGRDVITGEFRNYHSNGDMNVWHTGRNLSAIRKAGELVAQSASVNTMEQTDSQYNRIFSVTSGTVDHFYLTAFFEVDALRPMLNLNQVADLGEGDTIVPRNGNVIS